jgi:hypothetical protein
VTKSSVISRQSFFLNIADITIDLFPLEPEMKLQVEDATKDFLVDETEANVRVGACWKDLSGTTWSEKVFDSGSVWQLYRENGSHIFRFSWPAHGNIPHKIACFNQELTCGEVYLHRPFFNLAQSVYPLAHPLDELLIINLLARGRGVEIHACGVIDPSGNGHLFAGQSGAGKSTTARLWQKQDGITVLSDDRIILRKLDGEIWMYGTPWHGDAKLAFPARAPLKRVYFLKHWQENELIPIKGTYAAARLFACSFPPFYSREGLDFTLGFLGEVTKDIPCYELRFVPDQHVVDFIAER